MKNGIKFWGLLAVAATGVSMFGCVTEGTATGRVARENLPDPAEVVGVPWAEYTRFPAKDYTVVGTVVLRNPDMTTVIADIMERVIEMDGHDVINVRMSVDVSGGITAATAVAIRHTDATVNPASGTFVSDLSDIDFSLVGYGRVPTSLPDMVIRAPWSGQNRLFPSKDFVVVGAIVLRDTNSATVLADMMDQAVAMGGHDLMSVRLGIITEEMQGGEIPQDEEEDEFASRSRTVFRREVNVATAIVIRYTDENLTWAQVRIP
jgi:hypothetical protein